MQSLRELYKIGRGPSSSHSIGPDRASRRVREMYPEADHFKVILYGSLSLTGKGHLTDEVIVDAFAPLPVDVIFDNDTPCTVHPNTMDLFAYRGEKLLGSHRVYSVGGGTIRFEGEDVSALEEVYQLSTFDEITRYCREHNLRIWEYVEECEGEEIWDYLYEIWKQMKATIRHGLSATGTLKGGLETQRKANYLFNQRHIDESAQTKENRLVCAYAFAVSEQNAAGGTIVTAPTCGSCGVLPAVLKYMQDTRGFTNTEVIHALATGGIIGNLIKTNASISGAECGCQAEIGSACSMAAAALAELFEMGLDQIEYAAEVAMEHHLGLTCDPIGGLVQIPCIERNAVAAMRAINALSLANFLTSSRKISFDMVVRTMYETGRDIHGHYRETAQGGLAKHYRPEKKQ
ncbi:MAG: L-serine ammonia-lyase [Clostridia bacterium]|nr:L-serine ammonia-lyase [Clostridia bacterium]